MPTEVTVNVQDTTGPVTQQGFGLPLVFDPNTDISYQEVESTDGITGVTSGDIAYEQVSIMFAQEPSPNKVALYGVDVALAGSTIATELDDLVTQHDEWYWGVIASRTEAQITDFSNWIASQTRVGAAQLDITTTATGVDTYMGTISNDRMAIFAHDGGTASADQYLAAGLVGLLAAKPAAEYTAKFKTVNTVIDTTFQPGEVSTITGANANTYVSNKGQLYVTEGVMSEGTFIDTTVAKDWFVARYQEEIFRILKNYDKISFDDEGIAQIAGSVNTVNSVAIDKGLVAVDEDGNYLVEVNRPLRSDLSSNDIANRQLKGLESIVTYSGAIHTVQLDFVFQL